MKEKLERLINFCMWNNLVMFTLIGFLFKYVWLLAILQAYYIGKTINKEEEKLKREKWKKEEKQKYLKKFRILKLTMGEWIVIMVLILIVIGLILLYI